MATKWWMKSSNDQTSGVRAALTFPGNLWWILPLAFLGGWGMQNLLDGAPRLDSPRFTTILLSIFGGIFIAWLVGVYFSDLHKRHEKKTTTPPAS